MKTFWLWMLIPTTAFLMLSLSLIFKPEWVKKRDVELTGLQRLQMRKVGFLFLALLGAGLILYLASLLLDAFSI